MTIEELDKAQEHLKQVRKTLLEVQGILLILADESEEYGNFLLACVKKLQHGKIA